jgi:hypothetical protein
MGQRDEIVKLTLGVDIALTLYLEVHDGMFAHPWWRSIPVPGLFKSIPFDKFDIQISKVEEMIRETEARVRSIYEQATLCEKRHLAVLHQYTVALMNTVTAIRPIVRGLKGETDNKRYNMSTYNADIAAYKEAEKGYHALGEGMNRSWQAYQRSLIAA